MQPYSLTTPLGRRMVLIAPTNVPMRSGTLSSRSSFQKRKQYPAGRGRGPLGTALDLPGLNAPAFRTSIRLRSHAAPHSIHSLPHWHVVVCCHPASHTRAMTSTPNPRASIYFRSAMLPFAQTTPQLNAWPLRAITTFSGDRWRGGNYGTNLTLPKMIGGKSLFLACPARQSCAAL
jgi:hypothetical protein